jgi:ATP-dependent helicase HepA
MGIRFTFVQVESGTDGIGKLVDGDAKQVEIEYFESPAGPLLRRIRASIGSVREVELSPQTRIFWFDPGRHNWIAGRVDGGLISAKALGANEDHYHVRFPNGQDSRVPISQLYVRWSHPIEDPTHYLAARITDTPFFFDGRSQIVRHIAAQRAAFGGLTGLASSAVELLEHQVAIVRRVLSDPIERYLLADEVGLGKTIEAGILIRQHLIDQPRDARVLIVVPQHLVSQWKEELATKFFICSDSQIQVVPESALNSGLRSSFPTMLVVDEAQRIALRAFSAEPGERQLYERLQSLAIGTPRLLLLSGTPVLHQEDEFLAMLHLLDPDAYQLSDRDSFRRRVGERQAVAEATIDLTDDASILFAQDAIDKLEAAFREDRLLMELCSAVKAHILNDVQSSERIAALRALRTHISETYRLHRRLLRTRRGDRRVEVHLPQRRGMNLIQHEDQGRLEAFDFLDAWRFQLAPDVVGNAAWQKLFGSFVVAALSHPRVLLRRIEARLANYGGNTRLSNDSGEHWDLGNRWAFEGEEEFLEQRRKLIAECLGQDDRAHRLADWLRSGSEAQKAIVFVDDKEVAEIVSSTLRRRLAPGLVIRYEGESESLRAFEKSKVLTVLVCDGSVEEGLNLQRCGAIVVHYDLPLEPARIEQRIGRVDRIESRGHVRNVVLSSCQPYEREWLTCLDQAIRVFNRSTAPLQYALAEATVRIRSRLLQDGRVAIDDEIARLSDSKRGLDFELRQIEAQEAIDAVEINPDQDADFFEVLLQNDEAIADNGEQIFNSWVTDRLQFERQVVGPKIVRYIHDSRRPTLVPLFDTLVKFRECVDPDELKSSRARLPFRPVTFERASAETGHVELLRVGHPFMDALESMIRDDDRGTAFAVWRYLPRSVRAPRSFFRFDFLVEADLDPIYRVDDALIASRQALRRRVDESFPVGYRTVWLTSDLDEVKHPKLLEILQWPYTRHTRSNGARDVNLRLERWDRAATMVSLGDWAELCARARKAAERVLRTDPAFREGCIHWAARTRDSAVATANVFASRTARLSGTVKAAEEQMARMEASVREAIAQGIEEPNIRVDSTGLVILASTLLADE